MPDLPRSTLADRYADLLEQTEANLRRSQAVLYAAESALAEAQDVVEHARQLRTIDRAAHRCDAGADRDPSSSPGSVSSP